VCTGAYRMAPQFPWGDISGQMQEVPPADPILVDAVKLVVWDLDDTFWTGTLSEGGVTAIPANVQLVKRLAERGIVSTICSKNDREAVQRELTAMGIWDYFVSPSISFQPKGASIAALLDALRLRSANCVFIDDNPAVLAEAAFACPGLVCLDTPEQLAARLDSEALRGRYDPELTRLAQYRAIAHRHDRQQVSGLGSEAFLRQSDIRIEIDYDVEPHIDRVIELVNRSNQLNYTKVRVEGDTARAELLDTFRAYGFKAGIVRLSDRYADYGIVGFFLTLATLQDYRLEHFVFSCRIMNMGVEQYVYDFLNRPSIDVVAPVANPILSHEQIDWIGTGPSDEAAARLRDYKLVLIGGCDMLQLSTYCSMNSAEFTNRDEGGIIKRLDDPFLILDDPEQVRRSEIRAFVPAFNADDMVALRDAVSGADAIICSFFRMMEINYFRGSDGLMVRFDEDAVRAILASDRALWFVRNFAFVSLSHEERNALIEQALAALLAMVKPGARIIVMLENVRKLESNQNEFFLRGLYNDFVKRLCARNPALIPLDVNAVTNIEWLFDDGFHMHRQGYFELAEAVRAIVDGNATAECEVATPLSL
jgi:FkbH-like protein